MISFALILSLLLAGGCWYSRYKESLREEGRQEVIRKQEIKRKKQMRASRKIENQKPERIDKIKATCAEGNARVCAEEIANQISI